MRARICLLGLALFFVGAAVCVAQAPEMGTWKLNDAKSKFGPGATKNHTVKYEADGDNIKVTVDGMTADGKAVHSEWTGKFDGKDYPCTGDPTLDARAYKKINENKLELTNKLSGKVTGTANIVVSPDGKSRTVTSTSTDEKGKKVKATAVYDKVG